MELEQRPIEQLEAAIGYTFTNKKILCEALTHSSYSNEMKSKGLCPLNRCKLIYFRKIQK